MTTTSGLVSSTRRRASSPLLASATTSNPWKSRISTSIFRTCSVSSAITSRTLIGGLPCPPVMGLPHPDDCSCSFLWKRQKTCPRSEKFLDKTERGQTLGGGEQRICDASRAAGRRLGSYLGVQDPVDPVLGVLSGHSSTPHPTIQG